MKIKVEACQGTYRTYRLTLPDGSRESICAEDWTRRTASEALDMLEALYHLDRRKIRFDVH